MKRYTFGGVLIFISFIGISKVFVGYSAELPYECQTECASPYGKVIGVSRTGIESYSNCNYRCVIYEPNYLEGTFTGIKWQCVEYTRRWLLVNRGAVYGDVDIAADIWTNIHYLTEIATRKILPFESHLNGSKQPPQVGDLLVYSKELHNTGHVAVVVVVDKVTGFIEVGEQNYDNILWPGEFSRKIELIKKGDEYWLLDPYLLGWKNAKN